MNVTYTRHLYETVQALTAHKTSLTQRESHVPRSARASYAHYQLVQGVFQAVVRTQSNPPLRVIPDRCLTDCLLSQPLVIVQVVNIMYDQLNGRAKISLFDLFGLALSMQSSGQAFAEMGLRIHGTVSTHAIYRCV